MAIVLFYKKEGGFEHKTTAATKSELFLMIRQMMKDGYTEFKIHQGPSTRIPERIYRAKHCCDISDVNIALSELKEWCALTHGETPDNLPFARNMYQRLLERKRKFENA